MTIKKETGRHRSSQKTVLANAVSSNKGRFGRRAALLAAASGLLVTAAVPANAADSQDTTSVAQPEDANTDATPVIDTLEVNDLKNAGSDTSGAVKTDANQTQTQPAAQQETTGNTAQAQPSLIQNSGAPAEGGYYYWYGYDGSFNWSYDVPAVQYYFWAPYTGDSSVSYAQAGNGSGYTNTAGYGASSSNAYYGGYYETPSANNATPVNANTGNISGPASDTGNAIANAAQGQVGNASWCTEVVANSLAAAGINANTSGNGDVQGYNIAATPSAQIVYGNYQAGDILQYNGMHVAVSIGNGQAVHGGWGGYPNVAVASQTTGTYGDPAFGVRFSK